MLVGGVVSGTAFVTVTLRAAEVVALVLVSVARAVIEAVPSAAVVESQLIEYGLVVSVPTRVAPTKNSTLATIIPVTLALSVTEPVTVVPPTGLVSVTPGA